MEALPTKEHSFPVESLSPNLINPLLLFLSNKKWINLEIHKKYSDECKKREEINNERIKTIAVKYIILDNINIR